MAHVADTLVLYFDSEGQVQKGPPLLVCDICNCEQFENYHLPSEKCLVDGGCPDVSHHHEFR